MFDSGVGGLTVLHECLVSLPEEDFVYLGDTAMFPYGTRDPERLRERIRAIAELLLAGGAKLLVIACNTATSIGEDVAREVGAEHGVEVVPVVEPQAEIAAAITDSGQVGVLATPNTVASGAYRRALEEQGRALEVTEVEAPDLAPFIQDGSPFDQAVVDMARAYCAPLKRAEVDTLILGCTHYPLVAPMLQRILGRDVRLVSGGHAVAAAAQRTLERAGLARAGSGRRRATASSAAATSSPSASWAPASCRCPWAMSSMSTSPGKTEHSPRKIFTFGRFRTHICVAIWERRAMTTTSAVLPSGNTVYTPPVAKVMISMPDDVLARLDAQARANRETRSGFLRRLAERELDAELSQEREQLEALLDRATAPWAVKPSG